MIERLNTGQKYCDDVDEVKSQIHHFKMINFRYIIELDSVDAGTMWW